MKNQDELRQRCKNFLDELEYPVSRLAKKIGCARETLYNEPIKQDKELKKISDLDIMKIRKKK